MMQIISTKPVNHGSHFRAHVLRGYQQKINPFIAVDHAWMSGPTFPPHPHAGFSAVSYVFLDSEVGIDNQDSTGIKNLIKPGGLHWAVAGKGIVHEEVPAELGKTVHQLQIFVDLPEAKRWMEPLALTLEAEDVPCVKVSGAKVRIPVGEFNGMKSQLTTPTDVTILDITLEASASIDLTVKAGTNAFVLPVSGEFSIGNHTFSLAEQNVPVFSSQTGDQTITVTASGSGAKVMFFSGQPL
ncbi:pirin family protein [Alteromonas sp. 1_MG-2023]|uniref:pirin family protein n=1 Tax=Alteromonas sp. 1_MG-2023 TaxID=3062669 RepID=UPI0026E27151|nr:pirin family protein [Alteromonas sp. 1_MG-2023]MDO6477359.1 pirin family protein [Alteromonas sp. 1_MG-2023]